MHDRSRTCDGHLWFLLCNDFVLGILRHVHHAHVLRHSRRQDRRERAVRTPLRCVLVHFADVLAHCLFGAEELAALWTRYVAHVAMHAHVVAVATLLICREVTLGASHDWCLLVQ